MGRRAPGAPNQGLPLHNRDGPCGRGEAMADAKHTCIYIYIYIYVYHIISMYVCIYLCIMYIHAYMYTYVDTSGFRARETSTVRTAIREVIASCVYIYIYIGVYTRPCCVSTSCMFMGSTRSGSCFEGGKSSPAQAIAREIRPEGC